MNLFKNTQSSSERDHSSTGFAKKAVYLNPRSWLIAGAMALFLPATAAQAAYCSIGERCASILMDANSGEILSANDPDKPVYPASVTKLMTLYLLFEVLESGHVSLNHRIRISQNAAAQDPSKIGLRPGQTISVEDAIEAIAVKSANDIAVAVAEAISGNVSTFAYRMNSKAVALGMTNSSFRNPSGLPDEAQHTTARDMATLARRLLNDFPQYKHYLGLTGAHIAGKHVPGHNRLLNRDECTGGKTGFIRASGFNLVAWKERENRTVIGAVFGGDTIASRDTYMANLLRSGFGEPMPVESAPMFAHAEHARYAQFDRPRHSRHRASLQARHVHSGRHIVAASAKSRGHASVARVHVAKATSRTPIRVASAKQRRSAKRSG